LAVRRDPRGVDAPVKPWTRSYSLVSARTCVCVSQMHLTPDASIS
jgi:hypothetical protein